MYWFRTNAMTAVFCFSLSAVVCIPVAAQTFEDHRTLVESKLAVLGESEERKDFDAARDSLYQVLRQPQRGKKFEYAALFVKLLNAADRRIDKLSPSDGGSGFGDDGLLGAGILSGGGEPSFDNLSIDTLAPDDSNSELTAKQRSLKQYLPKYTVAITRNFFILYRQVFAGKEDLTQIVEMAIDDAEQRTTMVKRLSAEFEEIDKKYTIVSGRLVPRRRR